MHSVFTVFLVVSVFSLVWGFVLMFNIGASADALAGFYARRPRWYPKFGNDNPKIVRAGGAVSAGFGVALLLVDLVRFR
jgi:hypothetical protein